MTQEATQWVVGGGANTAAAAVRAAAAVTIEVHRGAVQTRQPAAPHQGHRPRQPHELHRKYSHSKARATGHGQKG